MPWKEFLDGQILDASEVNDYFMNQAVLVFATTTARNAAITSPIEGMFSYITTDDVISIYQVVDGVGSWTPQLALIEDDAVTTLKILDEAVTTAKIDDGAVTAIKLGTGAVTSDKILNETIANTDISTSAAIAHSKLATTTAGNILIGTTTTGVITGTAVTGDVTITGAGVTAIGNGAVTSAKLANSLTLPGTTTFGQIVEKAATNDTTTLSSTVTNIDILSGTVYRFTNASHTTGFKLNLRGDGTPTTLSSLMTANTQAITVCVSVVSGASPISFAASDYLRIDGTSTGVTIKWFAGTKPSGTANSEDFYTFTIFKTGATAFTVFASQSRFA